MSSFFPLTKKFRATTFLNAFLLNSINVTLSTFIGYITHFYIQKNHNIADWITILITIIVTFTSCFLVHLIMFYLFAFGEGMLANKKEKKEYHIHNEMKKLKKRKTSLKK